GKEFPQKKVLSLVLCVAVMLSVMVMGAGAAFSDQDKIENKEAVDMCAALNIIGGYPDGSYKPEGNIKRSEICKMICVALNGGEEPTLGTPATPTFSDVRNTPNAAWAEKYIESCVSQGIVSGVGGGRFSPNGNVTASQLSKMLLVSLGYDSDIEGYTGNAWDMNVNVRATQVGLYKGLEGVDVSAALTRDTAAQMVWNALQAKEVGYEYTLVSENGQLVSKTELVPKATTLLESKYEGKIVEGTLSQFSYNTNKEEWTYEIAVSTSDTVQVKSTQDFTALMGQIVKAVYDNNTTGKIKDAYGIFATDSEVVLTARFGDLPKMTTATDTSFKVDGVTYKLDKALNETPVMQFTANNNTKYEAETLYAVAGGDTVKYDAQTFTAVDKDGNGKIDFFSVAPFQVLKVNYVNKTEFRLSNNMKYTIEDVNVYDGIAKDDYVVYTAAANTSTDTDTFVKADMISGKITQKDGNDVYVDGNWYTLDDSYTGSGAVGTVLADAVVVNGYLFYADESGATNVEDYVVVVDSNLGAAYGDTVKLLFSDGTKKVVDLDKFVGVTGTGTSGAIQATNIEGKLFTYDTNKDGEYTLTAASVVGTGFDKAANNGQVKAQSSSSSKAGYIDNYAIADDAVIFVKYNTNDYKVISGATMKTMTATQFTAVSFYLATDNSNTGVGDVNMAYVTSNATTIKGGDTFYGFVTSSIETENEDGDKILSVTLWTAEGEKKLNTVKVTGSSLDALTTGAVVSYDLDSDGNIDTAEAVGESAAITSWDGNAMTFAGDTERHEMSDDVEYIFIDDSEDVGVDGLTSKDIALADEPSEGAFTSNAYILIEDDEVVLVVYDVDNEVDAKETLLTGITKADDVKKAADGVYTPTEKTFAEANDITGDAKDNRIIKFSAPEKAAYTLTIVDSKGEQVYEETSEEMEIGPHFFYICVNGASSSAPNAGEGTYKDKSFAKGSYNVTVITGTGDNVKTVLTGSFTV
ncbi:MAG: S-layer homology domain-containing protein, partial [Oscillospiraceae bacterium]|nr:S-layer homology domain-containing protein [Oscillospiraceae bacterium]